MDSTQMIALLATLVALAAAAWLLLRRRPPPPRQLGEALATLPPGSMRGKVALVTGGTSGVGYATAAALASQGCRVIITSRSRSRAEATARTLTQALSDQPGLPAAVPDPAAAVGMELDVSSLESVRRLAEQVLGRFDRLDALVLNAGEAPSSHPAEGVDGGLEWHYTQRVAAGHLLTSLLAKRLAESGSQGSPARVVSTSGWLMSWLSRTAADVAKWLEAEGEFEGRTIGKAGDGHADPMAAMVANAGWVRALAVKTDRVLFTLSHPGMATGTGLMGKWAGRVAKLLLGGHTAAEASLSNVACVMLPPGLVTPGGLVGPAKLMHGPPALTDLRQLDGASESWPVMAGPAAESFGEMVLREVEQKTAARVQF